MNLAAEITEVQLVHFLVHHPSRLVGSEGEAEPQEDGAKVKHESV